MSASDQNNLYESDYYGWLNKQLHLLRSGQWQSADIQNIAEEIEDMSKKLKRELESRLRILLMHLLKWQYQPDRRGKSWEMTIKVQRRDITDLLTDNPSLKTRIPEAMNKAYRNAVFDAYLETGLPEEDFPPSCLWDYDQMMNTSFWPDRFNH